MLKLIDSQGYARCLGYVSYWLKTFVACCFTLLGMLCEGFGICRILLLRDIEHIEWGLDDQGSDLGTSQLR